MSTLDRDYPRMLFHRSLPAVTVYTPTEEKALGPGWSRTILAQEPEAPDDDEEPEQEPEPIHTPPDMPIAHEPKGRAVKRHANR